jgi:hypothetical protein
MTTTRNLPVGDLFGGDIAVTKKIENLPGLISPGKLCMQNAQAFKKLLIINN